MTPLSLLHPRNEGQYEKRRGGETRDKTSSTSKLLEGAVQQHWLIWAEQNNINHDSNETVALFNKL